MSVSASPACSSSSPAAATVIARVSLLIAVLYFVSPLVEVVNSSTTTTTTTNKTVPVHHKLSPSFYDNSCPQVENIIASITAQRFRVSPASGPATLRLFFHDCFVEGCDVSILISPGLTEEKVERDVEDNKNLAPEGFETISIAKEAVEGKCPGVVSCSDILAIAARDFVHLVCRRSMHVAALRGSTRTVPRAACRHPCIRAGPIRRSHPQPTPRARHRPYRRRAPGPRRCLRAALRWPTCAAPSAAHLRRLLCPFTFLLLLYVFFLIYLLFLCR